MNVYIDKSSIHGRGVFANELIETDDWQWVYGDLRIILPGDRFEPYGVEWDHRTFIPYAPWCCVNHSTTPNCEINETESSRPILIITALRTILPDEEILIDYGYDPSEN